MRPGWNRAGSKPSNNQEESNGAMDLFGRSWRLIFLVNIPIGLVTVDLAGVCCQRQRPWSTSLRRCSGLGMAFHLVRVRIEERQLHPVAHLGMVPVGVAA